MDAALELYPDVRFEPDFAARAERAVARLARRRAAHESSGRSWTAGAGDDVAGARAYRPGDDPRSIDWTASARGDEVIVRLKRRARGGSEVIAIDASRSMAVGPPGKLQRAAEIAAVLALLAARNGAVVTVLAPPSRGRFVLDAPARFAGLLAWLAELRAELRVDWSTPPIGRCERATWIGDLAGVAPDVLARAAPRTASLRVVQVLAPHEIDPRNDARFEQAAVLVDPESGARLAVDHAAAVAHARALEARESALRRELARRGAPLVRASSSEPCEAACARLVDA